MVVTELRRELGVPSAQIIYEANRSALHRHITPAVARWMLVHIHDIPVDLLDHVDDGECVRYAAMSLGIIVPGRKTRIVATFDLIQNDPSNLPATTTTTTNGDIRNIQHPPYRAVVILSLVME